MGLIGMSALSSGEGSAVATMPMPKREFAGSKFCWIPMSGLAWSLSMILLQLRDTTLSCRGITIAVESNVKANFFPPSKALLSYYPSFPVTSWSAVKM